MTSQSTVGLVVMVLVMGAARAEPGGYREVSRPLSVVSDLGQYLSARGALLQAGPAVGGDPRLPLPPLPSAQDLEAIKKVAQILVMLGEQVIPSLIEGPQPPRPAACDPPDDLPNDPVADN